MAGDGAPPPDPPDGERAALSAADGQGIVGLDLSHVRSLPDRPPCAVVPARAASRTGDGTPAFRGGETWRPTPLNDGAQTATREQELPASGATDLYPTPFGTKP